MQTAIFEEQPVPGRVTLDVFQVQLNQEAFMSILVLVNPVHLFS